MVRTPCGSRIEPSNDSPPSNDSTVLPTTPATNRAYFKRQEMILYDLLRADKPQSLNPGDIMDSAPSHTCRTVDYEDAWVAIGSAVDDKGKHWSREIWLKEQSDINKEYDLARAHSFFQMQQKEASTKLLDGIEKKKLQRARSDPSFSYSTTSKASGNRNDNSKTVVVNTGVNWVCPQNPTNSGLNATCLQPSLKSALTSIRPADCTANFNIQGNSISIRREVQRLKVEDKVGKLHDETKIYFIESTSGRTISPWHDISLICHAPPSHITKAHGLLVNMVVEIPRFESAKMEISTAVLHNPIIQDRCKKLQRARYYSGPIPWNYGALPQTWEDPEHAGDGEVNNALGDGDPLDVVEVGRQSSREFAVGEVVPIRVLGCLPMLDGGDELDWKIIGINCYDDNFDRIHDLYSLEEVYPHTLTGVREWFRWYKFTDKQASLNDFGYMGLVICRCGAENIVENTHCQWRDMIRRTHKIARDRLSNESDYLGENTRSDISFKGYGSGILDHIWVPTKLRQGSKAWNDRHVMWNGYLGRNSKDTPPKEGGLGAPGMSIRTRSCSNKTNSEQK